MAQKTAWNGAALTESDINTYLMGEGGAWTTYAPTLTQSSAIAGTVTRAVWARYGRTIHFSVRIDVTGSGVAANGIFLSLPVAASTSAILVAGTGIVTDTSASLNYVGGVYLDTTTRVGLIPAAGAVGPGYLGAVTMTAALASGDVVLVAGTYEAAT